MSTVPEQSKHAPPAEVLRMLPLRAVHVEGTESFHRIVTAKNHFVASCVNAREAEAFVELCNGYAALQSQNATLTQRVERAEKALRSADVVLEEWIGILEANGLRHSVVDGETARAEIDAALTHAVSP